MIIAEVGSGVIEITEHDGTVRIEFNCSCEDALPYCKAACCKGRDLYNTSLTQEEAGRYNSKKAGDEWVLVDFQGKCSYLTEDNLCSTHSDKPKSCSSWHCSPNGVGRNLTQRGEGWVLVPSFMIS